MTTPPAQPQTPSIPPTEPPAQPTAPPANDDPAQLREQLAQAEARLAQMRRRHELENALRDAGAIDVEAAATLIDALRDPNSNEPEAPAAVSNLKQRRPYLFRAPPAPSAGSAMSPAPASAPDTALHRAAEDARAGDPNAVLRYMRLRREVH